MRGAFTALGDDRTIKVNDQVTAHYVDAERRSRQGHFALQAMNPPTTLVQFRKIEVKELSR